MAYRDQLYPWCIIRSLSNAPPTVVARFRRPTDAEAHLKILRRSTPEGSLAIVFEKVTSELALSEISDSDRIVSEAVISEEMVRTEAY